MIGSTTSFDAIDDWGFVGRKNGALMSRWRVARDRPTGNSLRQCLVGRHALREAQRQPNKSMKIGEKWIPTMRIGAFCRLVAMLSVVCRCWGRSRVVVEECKWGRRWLRSKVMGRATWMGGRKGGWGATTLCTPTKLWRPRFYHHTIFCGGAVRRSLSLELAESRATFWGPCRSQSDPAIQTAHNFIIERSRTVSNKGIWCSPNPLCGETMHSQLHDSCSFKKHVGYQGV